MSSTFANMKVATLTTNPAIDLTVTLANLTQGAVNRAQAMRSDAGGKGVIVAMRLADFGVPVVATGFLGADNAEIFEHTLAQKGISDAFVRVDGQTRTNVKLIDSAQHLTTDINAVGIEPNTQAVAQLWTNIDALSADCQWFVIGGQLQASLPVTLYADIIRTVKSRGCQVIADTSGQALRHALDAGADIVKPNIHELSELVGRTLNDIDEVRTHARALLNQDTRMVVVSMGEQGALFVTADAQLIARPPAVMVKSTVGAGDAMVAGVLAGVLQQLPLADCARLATAFSLAAVTRLTRDLPAPTVIAQWQKEVQIEQFG
ncbi:MAG: fructose-phosphate kinase [Burkholderiaceae bacterium]|nr:fructose-phosphate kinase [Burkholderiaceae bacterium]